MFKAKIEPKNLTPTLECLSAITNEAILTLTTEAITTKRANDSNTAMIDLQLKKEAFSEYTCDSEHKIAIDIDKLLDLVKEAKETIDLELLIAEQKLLVRCDSNLVFTIALIDPTAIKKDSKIPQLKYTMQTIIDSKDLRRITKAGEKVEGEAILKVNANNDRIVFEAIGDLDKAELELTKDKLSKLELNGVNEAKALYSIEYLSQIVKTLSGDIELSFASDYPLMLKSNSESGYVCFVVAPRIETT